MPAIKTNYFGEVDENDWNDWKWQISHAITKENHLEQPYMGIAKYRMKAVHDYVQHFRLNVTPYTMNLIKPCEWGNPSENAIWSQFFPLSDWRPGSDRPDGFCPGMEDNWEEVGMVTPIAQHLYHNRICIRFPRCLGHCTFCLEARQVTAQSGARLFNEETWQQTIEYIKSKKHCLEEVIFSGGDPLSESNDNLDRYLGEIRGIEHIRFIRIHTRALTFCPMRIDEGLASILKKYRVDAVHIGVAHLREILTPQFDQALDRLRKDAEVPHIRAHTPFLRGVNDQIWTLKELFLGLYEKGIDPYYLIHAFPHIATADYHRPSIKTGADIMRRLKRNITNSAMPEYIIAPVGGKITVASEFNGTPEFRYEMREDGWPQVRAVNWRGEWAEYLDSP